MPGNTAGMCCDERRTHLVRTRLYCALSLPVDILVALLLAAAAQGPARAGAGGCC